MVWSNPVRTFILTQKHDEGHATMDIVCWKCKKACICEPATESDIWDLVSFEKSQNTLGKIMIHMTMIIIHKTMNACFYFIVLNFIHYI